MSHLVLLGLQHLFVMFGATVLVPLLTGLDVAVALFASGAGTLLFHLVSGGQVPVYLGSSFAFIPVILAIKAESSLAVACGAIAVAGALYAVVAAIVRFASLDLIRRVLPPHVTGSMILLIGLMLAEVAVQNSDGTHAPELVASIGTDGCWAVALFTLGAGVVVRVHAARWGLRFLSTVPVLAGLLAGYLLSLALGIVSFDAVGRASWLDPPAFSAPEFRPGAIVLALPVAIVTMVEHVGDVLAIGHVVGKDFFHKPGLHRTLLGDGLATSLSACLGGPANTTYSENTGTVALTGNHDPTVMRIAALLAVALAFVPKFDQLIGTIPSPVRGGISILLFGMIAAVGIRTFVDQRVDLGRPRVLVVTSVMLVLGVGGGKLELGQITLSGLGLAALAGILLNWVLGEGSEGSTVGKTASERSKYQLE